MRTDIIGDMALELLTRKPKPAIFFRNRVGSMIAEKNEGQSGRAPDMAMGRVGVAHVHGGQHIRRPSAQVIILPNLQAGLETRYKPKPPVRGTGCGICG